MKIQYLLTLLSLLAFFACETENTTPIIEETSTDFCTTDDRFTSQEYFSIDEIETSFDVLYGSATDWQGATTDLRMDVYAPAIAIDDLSSRPAIMVMHGGGFRGGDKLQWQGECLAFAKRGFVAISIQYRLGWDLSDPMEQLRASYRANQDARAAMRFIVANADQYQVNTDWLFIGGSSAGAINALNTVYTDHEEWQQAFPGLFDDLGDLNTSSNSLTNTYSIKGVFNNWGSTFGLGVQTEEMVPTIAFHGALDNTVPIDSGEFGLIGSRSIHERLQGAQVCSELSVLPDGGHGNFYRDEAGDAFRVARASCFFKRIMCDNCTSLYTEQRIEPDC